MKKFLLPGILAVLSLFLPPRSQAVPLDVPYQILVTTTSTTSIVLSTTNFPSGTSSVNANVALYQWCVDHAVVSVANSASTFTIAWSSSTLLPSTTDYTVVTSTGVPYDAQWPYRDPYCAPVGWPIVTLKSTVTGAILSVQGYLWKGWNP